MRNVQSTYRDLAVETCLAAIACSCVGFVAFGSSIFSIYNHKFVFIAEGLTGSFTFYCLRRLRARDAILFILVLFFLQVMLLTRTREFGAIVMEFIFFVAVPLASAIFFWSYRKHLHEVRIYDPLILGAFVAVTVSMARTILYVKMTLEANLRFGELTGPYSFFETLESFLIGLGIGLGLWILDFDRVKQLLHVSKGFVTRAA